MFNFSLRFLEESVFCGQQKHLGKTKKFRPEQFKAGADGTVLPPSGYTLIHILY